MSLPWLNDSPYTTFGVFSEISCNWVWNWISSCKPLEELISTETSKRVQAEKDMRLHSTGFGKAWMNMSEWPNDHPASPSWECHRLSELPANARLPSNLSASFGFTLNLQRKMPLRKHTSSKYMMCMWYAYIYMWYDIHMMCIYIYIAYTWYRYMIYLWHIHIISIWLLYLYNLSVRYIYIYSLWHVYSIWYIYIIYIYKYIYMMLYISKYIYIYILWYIYIIYLYDISIRYRYHTSTWYLYGISIYDASLW